MQMQLGNCLHDRKQVPKLDIWSVGEPSQCKPQVMENLLDIKLHIDTTCLLVSHYGFSQV